MIPSVGYQAKRVGVLGMGRSGLAAARSLTAAGAEPICWDDGEAGRAAAEAEGFAVADLSRAGALAGCAALIVSPGVPHLYPAPHPAAALALAIGVPVDNDVGLFFSALAASPHDPPARVAAITGSNGKSTTAALAHHLLKAAGRPAQLGGNIGRGVLDLDPPAPGETVVLELSSYQTDVARRLAPDIAALTNLSPDHLDRHGGIGGYFAAKTRLFAAGPVLGAIVGADEPEGRWLANRIGPSARRIVGAEARLAGQGEEVLYGAGALTRFVCGAPAGVLDLSAADALRGAHNAQNAAVALLIGATLGIDDAAARAAFESFGGLEHRMRRIATRGGVAYVDDSKATNADATEKALRSFERIRWILGGRAKAGGIASLVPLLGRVEKAYLIGECAEAFAQTLSNAGTAHARCGALSAAVKQAAAEAQPGEVVLLSPAAASFDQFQSFEARGRAFADAVAGLPPAPD